MHAMETYKRGQTYTSTQSKLDMEVAERTASRPGIHWIGDQVGSRVDPDVLEREQVFAPAQNRTKDVAALI